MSTENQTLTQALHGRSAQITVLGQPRTVYELNGGNLDRVIGLIGDALGEFKGHENSVRMMGSLAKDAKQLLIDGLRIDSNDVEQMPATEVLVALRVFAELNKDFLTGALESLNGLMAQA